MACSWLYFFVVVWPAVLVSRIRGKRVVLNYHGGQADRFFALYRPVVKPAFQLAHVVTAPSLFLVDVISRRIGVPVRIVPNIVALASFPYRERAMWEPKLLVTRHLQKLYDIESIIRAFGDIQNRYPAASLWIAGTGDQERYLRDLAAALRLNNVRFLGYVPQPELPAVYAQCDILVNASRADNFPGSLVEAAASGLVVISTAVGGIPYIFENGKSALLVDAGDWRGLAAAVLRVLDDPGLALRLSREALRQCRQYDWQNIRASLYPIYGFEKHSLNGPETCASPGPGLALQKPGGQTA
jgi:glycosyltransferase involved in cell wall biosynthesis